MIIANLAPQLQGILVAAAVLAIGYGLGKRFYKQADFFVALTLGLGVLGFAVYFIGQLHLLYRAVIFGGLALSLIAAAKPLRDLIANFKKSVDIKRFDIAWLAFLPLVLFLLWQLIGALAPEVKFDSLWYHLTQAKVYLLEHKIRAFLPPAQLGQSSVTPRLIDMLYTLQLALSPYEIGPKALHWAFAVLILAGVYTWTRQFAGRAGACAATTLLASFPIFGWLAQTAYIDLGVTFFGLVLLRRAFSVKRDANLVVLGVIAGLFLSTKLWALLLAPVVVTVLLQRGLAPSKIVKSALIAALVASPWFIEAFIWTGNPVFPVFSINDPDHLGGASSLRDWFLRVYPNTFPDLWQQINHNFPLLALGLGAVLFVFGKGRDKSPLILAAVGIIGILGWSILPVRDDRYALIFILPLVVSFGILISRLSAKTFGKIMVVLALAPVIFLNFLILWGRTINYFPVSFGLESRHDYLTRVIGPNIWSVYDIDGFFVKTVEPDSRVALLAHNMFYADYNFVDGFDLVARNQGKVSTAEQALELLKNEKVKYIVVKTAVYSIESWTQQLFGQADSGVNKQFLNHFRQIYDNQFSNTRAYRLDY